MVHLFSRLTEFACGRHFLYCLVSLAASDLLHLGQLERGSGRQENKDFFPAFSASLFLLLPYWSE